MPLYDFRCGGCDIIVELFVPSHRETSKCPHCGFGMHRMPPKPNIISDYKTYKTRNRKEDKIREMTKKFTEDK